MTAICITPPTELPVELAAAKMNMKIDGNDMDALVTGWIRGIVLTLEHFIGQCLMAQTWLVTLDAFERSIKLPHPVISVTSITYIDVDGVEQLLDPAMYRLVRQKYQTMLMPAAGKSWPATSADVCTVSITVVCGYGVDASATPDNIRLYILAKLTQQFDPITRMEKDTVQSAYIDSLLDGGRSYA